jgi:arylsulfatase A-like enzyme
LTKYVSVTGLFNYAQRIIGVMPDGAEDFVTSGYYRYKSWQANNLHTSPRRRFDRQPDAPDHVLVVVVDAFRPDADLSLPVEFGRAITPGTWTFPAVTSVHSGLYPHEHGAVAHTTQEDETFVIPNQASPSLTLPEALEGSDYETYAGLAFMTPYLALRGWYETHRVYRDARAERVVRGYEKWRNGRDRSFGYLHLGDLHAPLNPPEAYIERHGVDTSIPDLPNLNRFTADYDGSSECTRFREERLKLYRAALDYVEDVLSDLLAEIGDSTMVLVTGDHGEAHWEHYELDRQFTDSRPNYCVGHGGTPFDVIARVPAGVHTPDDTISPHGGPASLIDVPATICREVLTEQPFAGHEWQTTIPDSRAAICEATRYGTERKAVYQRGWKVIRGEADDVTLYSRPMERAGESFDEDPPQEVRDSLLGSLPDYWTDTEEAGEASQMVQEQLSALGYK